MSNELVTVNDIQKMAEAVAKSNLFGVKTPEQAMALMLIAQAEGSHPAIAVRDYHIIQNKPSLKADAMMARFQAAGGEVAWIKYTDEEVSGRFSHPQGGEVVITWTIEQAKHIGLTSKDSWKNYPRAMLRARVISEGIRTVYPGVVVGVYTPEEVADDNGKGEVIEAQAEELITDQQAADICALLDEIGREKYEPKFLTWLKVGSIEQIPAASFKDVIEKAESIRAKKATA